MINSNSILKNCILKKCFQRPLSFSCLWRYLIDPIIFQTFPISNSARGTSSNYNIFLISNQFYCHGGGGVVSIRFRNYRISNLFMSMKVVLCILWNEQVMDIRKTIISIYNHILSICFPIWECTGKLPKQMVVSSCRNLFFVQKHIDWGNLEFLKDNMNKWVKGWSLSNDPGGSK